MINSPLSTTTTTTTTMMQNTATTTTAITRREPLSEKRNYQGGTSQRKAPPSSRSYDRFIPNRNQFHVSPSWSELALSDKSWAKDPEFCPPRKSELSLTAMNYCRTMVDTLFPLRNSSERVFTFSCKSENSSSSFSSQNKTSSIIKVKRRTINQRPESVFDAPNLEEDFYKNLIDWSSSNVLAVALRGSIYVKNMNNGKVERLDVLPRNQTITSIQWVGDHQIIAIGTDRGDVRLVDGQESRLLRTFRGNGERMGALAWNGPILSIGRNDGLIVNLDVRIRESIVSQFKGGHQQRICGLKWNSSGNLLASGANDNLLLIWDKRFPETPRSVFNQHQSAVKALDWCPHRSNLLVSGGGTHDKHIRFWNVSTDEMIEEYNTGSQICSILWSKHSRNELVSAHGFGANQINIWKYPGTIKVASIDNDNRDWDSGRFLHLVMSPDGERVASGSSDELIKIWRIFDSPSPRLAAVMKDSHFRRNSRGTFLEPIIR